MSQENKEKMEKRSSQMMKITLVSLLVVSLFLVEMYEIINDPANMIVIGALGVFLLTSVYVGMVFIRKQMEGSAKEQEEAFDNVYRSEKASYLLIRKYFDQMDRKMENLSEPSNIPYKELIAAQKALAKAQINRGKQNTNALLISNDRMMQRINNIQNEITELVRNTSENNSDSGVQEQTVFAEGNKQVLEKQQEILSGLKDLETSLRNEILESADKLASMKSQQISVPQLQLQDNDDIQPLDVDGDFSFDNNQELQPILENSAESDLDKLLLQMDTEASLEPELQSALPDLEPIGESNFMEAAPESSLLLDEADMNQTDEISPGKAELPELLELDNDLMQTKSKSMMEDTELQDLIIDEPELQPIVKEEAEPELQPIMEQPELQPIMEDVVEEPELQPMMEDVGESQLQQIEEEPQLQPMIEESGLQPTMEEPELQPMMEEPELQPVMEEPELHPIMEESELEPIMEELELEPIVEEPELQPIMEEPELQPIMEEPELQPIMEEPELQPIMEQPELQPAMQELGSIPEITDELKLKPIAEEPQLPPEILERNAKPASTEAELQAMIDRLKPKPDFVEPRVTQVIASEAKTSSTEPEPTIVNPELNSVINHSVAEPVKNEKSTEFKNDSHEITPDRLAAMIANLGTEPILEEPEPIDEEQTTAGLSFQSVAPDNIKSNDDDELEQIMKAMDIDDILEEPVEDLDIDKILEVPLTNAESKVVESNSNQVMSSDEIAALIANTDLLSEPEPVKNNDLPDLSDPSYVMSSDEIAALIANM